MSEWISVEDRLPDEIEAPFVIVCAINGTCSWTQLGRYLPEYGGWHFCDNVMDSVEKEYDETITHWQPLPPPPTED